MKRRQCLAALGAAAAVPLAAAQEASALERIRRRGRLLAGLYHDMPPFHVQGEGIDVEIARLLAARLGVELMPLPFHAGENMDDDLRNMVWRGHYLGWGPADVLLHVPVERGLIVANPRVQVVAPYYRERVAIAWRREALGPVLESLSALRGRPVAVAGQSLAGWLLIGADGGAYRGDLLTQWKDGAEAARALLRGEVAAAGGLASELDSVLRGDARFAITPMPSPRAPREGWAVGMAVKRDASELAQALQRVVNELAASGRLREMFARSNVNWNAA